MKLYDQIQSCDQFSRSFKKRSKRPRRSGTGETTSIEIEQKNDLFEMQRK
jgi:hypothetical protein